MPQADVLDDFDLWPPKEETRMRATFDLSDARKQLSRAIRDRLIQTPPPNSAELVRFPVGLFFIRGDRGGDGAKLTEQVVKSYGYWNDESGEYLDVVFFGWGKDGEQIVYDATAFRRCKNALEGISKWRYSGETDLLLVNFEIPLKEGRPADDGNFSLKEAIPLPIEEMIRDKRVAWTDLCRS